MRYAVWDKWHDRLASQVVKGLVSGVDVSVYADARYAWDQMLRIRLGLETGMAHLSS